MHLITINTTYFCGHTFCSTVCILCTDYYKELSRMELLLLAVRFLAEVSSAIAVQAFDYFNDK